MLDEQKMAVGSPEPDDLVDVFYVPFVRPLGNLVVLFAQAEAAWLELVAELTGGTEKKEAQCFLQMKAQGAKQEIIPLAQASGIGGFDLTELSEGIESYYRDRECRNRLMHDEWWVDVSDGGLPKTRGLPRKKGAVEVWGDSTPDDVWRLGLRFREYKSLFSHRTYELRKTKTSSEGSDDALIANLDVENEPRDE